MREEIPLSSPDVGPREIEAVVEVLSSRHLSLGPRVPEFEATVAAYTGAAHAVACNSGTSALHMLVRAAALGPGDEVVTTPFSFVASSNCVLFEGATPVFADIDPITWDLDPDAAEAAITARTKALIPVHVFGRPCRLPALQRLAARSGLTIIEDSCESLGSTLDGRMTGTFGRAGVFAFYPNKQITTGEGGIIVTDDGELAGVLRSLRNQGRGADGSWLMHERLGYNYRLPDILCALGTVQMQRIEEFIALRQGVCDMYAAALADLDEIVLPAPAAATQRISWFVYVVALREGTPRERRDAVLQHLRESGIGCRNYFSPIHLQPFYRERFGLTEGMFPVTESVAARTIALPFFNRMTIEQVDQVAHAMRAALHATAGSRRS